MKIKYVEPGNMRPATRELLDQIMTVTEKYAKKGHRMTLRQLYYQLVSTDILPNEQRQYSKLSKILTDARMYGMVDWDIIEDRLRQPQRPAQWNGVSNILEDAAGSYRLDRHKGQEHYVEVWVEKDALSGVLYEVTAQYHVQLMVNRGYSSITAMHDAALRIMVATRHNNQRAYILYLGDHDPSGLDMIRDIRERLWRFGLGKNLVTVHPVALTYAQIEEYGPPPNPAKVTDPRASQYIEEHGHTSWELDALPPDALHTLLHEYLQDLIDMDLYKERIEVERDHRAEIQRYANMAEDGEHMA